MSIVVYDINGEAVDVPKDDWLNAVNEVKNGKSGVTPIIKMKFYFKPLLQKDIYSELDKVLSRWNYAKIIDKDSGKIIEDIKMFSKVPRAREEFVKKLDNPNIRFEVGFNGGVYNIFKHRNMKGYIVTKWDENVLKRKNESPEIQKIVNYLKLLEDDEDRIADIDFNYISYIKSGNPVTSYIGHSEINFQLLDGNKVEISSDELRDKMIVDYDDLKEAIKSELKYKVLPSAPSGWLPYQRQKMMIMFDPEDKDLIYVEQYGLYGAMPTQKNINLLDQSFVPESR